MLILLIIVFMATFFTFSCKKESLPCYECITTNIFITDPILPGYPDSTKYFYDLCNQTEEQIETYELLNEGSNVLVIQSMIYPDGVRITQFYSTKCTIK